MPTAGAVKAKNQPRHFLIYPRDAELKLPEGSEVCHAMERRILDFGINDTFDSLAQRWGIHYPRSISKKFVRRVVDRMGLRCEAAYSEESLQLACREKPEEPADMLVVATDGSTEDPEARARAASPTVNRLRSQNLPGSLSEPSAHWTKTSLRRSGAAASASGWNPVGHVLATDGCIGTSIGPKTAYAKSLCWPASISSTCSPCSKIRPPSGLPMNASRGRWDTSAGGMAIGWAAPTRPSSGSI